MLKWKISFSIKKIFPCFRFQRLSVQFKEFEMKLKDKDDEIFALKDSLTRRPEVKLHSDMNILLIEKVSLYQASYFFSKFRNFTKLVPQNFK